MKSSQQKQEEEEAEIDGEGDNNRPTRSAWGMNGWEDWTVIALAELRCISSSSWCFGVHSDINRRGITFKSHAIRLFHMRSPFFISTSCAVHGGGRLQVDEWIVIWAGFNNDHWGGRLPNLILQNYIHQAPALNTCFECGWINGEWKQLTEWIIQKEKKKDIRLQFLHWFNFLPNGHWV